MSTNKEVAVITSLYNGDDVLYARLALESLIAQDYGFENINIYIHVDGELDVEHERFMNEYSSFFKLVLHSSPNIGLAKGLNRLLLEVQEDYIFRMDLDDISNPERVSSQVAFMEENDEVSLLGCNAYEIDANGDVEIERKFPITDYEIKASMHKFCPILHPTFCFRKKIIDEGILYPDFYLTEDLGFIYMCRKAGKKFHNLDQTLFQWRKTDDFYKRRNAKRSFVEMMVYFKIIKYFDGFSFKYAYPVARFIFRFMPSGLVERVYNSGLRNWMKVTG